MRLMLFISRMAGMVALMVGVMLTVFVVLDVLRHGPNTRGFLLGTDIWNDFSAILYAVF